MKREWHEHIPTKHGSFRRMVLRPIVVGGTTLYAVEDLETTEVPLELVEAYLPVEFCKSHTAALDNRAPPP